MSGRPAEPCTQELDRVRRRLDRERTAHVEAELVVEESSQRLSDNQLLEQIAIAANQALSLRDVLQFSLTQICEFTGWPVGHVYLAAADAGGNRLQSAHIWHAPEYERITPFRLMTERSDLAAGQELPGRVQATGQPAWAADLTEYNDSPRQGAARDCGLRTACAFPILIGSEVVAVIEFYIRTILEPDEVLMRLMSQLGLQLGRVIERKSLGRDFSQGCFSSKPIGKAVASTLLDGTD